MPNSSGLSLPGLSMMAGGLLLVYTGVYDTPGGPVGALRSVLAGKPPEHGTQHRTSLGTGTFAPHVAGIDGVTPHATGNRGQIIATARSFLGVRYVFGGASRSGVDCSGLVLLSYKSVGISLPHKASLQAAKGRRIDRSQILPGDLVAWGAPGNYPHIALALDANQVIVAPHTGTVVQIQKLWEKKVPGFGYPDIYRILAD